MICQHCGARPGTDTWCETGVFGHIHGLSQQWCRVCVLSAQIANAKARCAELDTLVATLDRLLASDRETPTEGS